MRTIEYPEHLEEEIALGIIGRAQNVHESPGDEEIALQLRDIGQQLLEND